MVRIRAAGLPVSAPAGWLLVLIAQGCFPGFSDERCFADPDCPPGEICAAGRCGAIASGDRDGPFDPWIPDADQGAEGGSGGAAPPDLGPAPDAASTGCDRPAPPQWDGEGRPCLDEGALLVWHLDGAPFQPLVAPQVPAELGRVSGVTLAPGRIGGGARFSGQPDQGLELRWPGPGADQALSVELWVRPESRRPRQAVISNLWSAGAGWELSIRWPEGDRAATAAFIYVSPEKLPVYRVDAPVDLGRWHHLAIVISQARPPRTLQIVVDGTVYEAQDLPPAARGPLNLLGLGRRGLDPSGDRAGGEDLFQGVIDEIRVSSRARPVTDIQTMLRSLPPGAQ